MDVQLEGITCPSWQGSVAPTGFGVDPDPWVSSRAGIPFGAVGLCPQRQLGQDNDVPVDCLAGRRIYPGKWELKLLPPGFPLSWHQFFKEKKHPLFIPAMIPDSQEPQD